MRTPKVREVGEALRSLFSRPYTVQYPYKPIVPPERFRGKAKFFEDGCIACGACAQVCPARAIDVENVVPEDGTAVRRMTVHQDHCIYCGQCQRFCTTKEGIKLTGDFETGTYDRSKSVSTVEKELVVCRECGEVIATVDQIRWVAEKVGPKAFGNMSLALVLSTDLGLADDVARAPGRAVDRGDRVSFLCPRCRREIILYEQWGP